MERASLTIRLSEYRFPDPSRKKAISRRGVLKRGAAVAACIAGLPMGRVHAWSRGSCGGLSFDEFGRFDGLGLAELVRNKEVTPTELLDAAVKRAAEVVPLLKGLAGDL